LCYLDLYGQVDINLSSRSSRCVAGLNQKMPLAIKDRKTFRNKPRLVNAPISKTQKTLRVNGTLSTSIMQRKIDDQVHLRSQSDSQYD
jgi:hypothetical protein